LKDEDKELQREIAREVLGDFSKKDDELLEKKHEKYAEILENTFESVAPKGFTDLAAVPANSIKAFAKEADETEFAQGVMIYIEERQNGKSFDVIYSSPPEELIYGGLKGVSMSVNAKYPKALLYSKYEESYQRYLLAKELGRLD